MNAALPLAARVRSSLRRRVQDLWILWTAPIPVRRTVEMEAVRKYTGHVWDGCTVTIFFVGSLMAICRNPYLARFRAALVNTGRPASSASRSGEEPLRGPPKLLRLCSSVLFYPLPLSTALVSLCTGGFTHRVSARRFRSNGIPFLPRRASVPLRVDRRRLVTASAVQEARRIPAQ